jgi:hypothetical protein
VAGNSVSESFIESRSPDHNPVARTDFVAVEKTSSKLSRSSSSLQYAMISAYTCSLAGDYKLTVPCDLLSSLW